MDEESASPEPYLVPDLKLFLLAVAGLYTPGQEVQVSDGVRQATYTVSAAAGWPASTVALTRVKEGVSNAEGR